MYERLLLDPIREALADTPVVFLRGPRQSGKSTIAKQLCDERSGRRYMTLDDLSTLEATQTDPHALLENGGELIILDEVQRAPELFLVIKQLVDQDRRPGMFLLTGSADILLLPNIADSLAGRMEILTLYPLSIGEVNGRRDDLLRTLFANEVPTNDSIGLRQRLLERAPLGGFPEVQTRTSSRRREAWFHGYVTALMQRDVRALANIEHLVRLPNLLQLLATRSASLLNFGELARATGLPLTTLRRYFGLLQTVFCVHTLPAWSANLGKRLVKSPKLHLNDTGLLCHLLGIDSDGLKEDPKLFGQVLETLVVNEILSMSEWSELLVSAYHFRTSSGAEVDLVLQGPARRLVGIEVKASSRVTSSDFRGLKNFAEVAGKKFASGYLFYLGEERLSFGSNLHAIPVPFF